MKKITLILTTIFILFSSFQQESFAVKIKMNWIETTNISTSNEVSRRDIFNHLASLIDKEVTSSYKYIDLKFKNLDTNSELYKSLQKLVFLDLIKNTETSIHPEKKIELYSFLRLSEKVLGFDMINPNEIEKLKARNTTKNDLKKLNSRINIEFTKFRRYWQTSQIKQKKSILVDVYDILIKEHYEKGNISEDEILNSAIEWITKGIGDKHTVYFPPTESKDFNEWLNGEYEGIGSYVLMETPWIVKIISPISWSPSQKAWLQSWDIISKVNGKIVTKENSLKEVISWIKWPAWSAVTLTIIRWWNEYNIDVTREKIIIINVESKLLTKDTYYIQIKSFWDNVSKNFKNALEGLKKQRRVKKVIIDLRNNGWGYLWQVADILSHFVEEWKPTAVVKYLKSNQQYTSRWYNMIDFNDYKIVILQNSWTASASEILIGTIKDYFPNTTIIWEKSYWKWSVQTIREYKDGSTLKYTIAKWFTGKTQTGIDWIGILPTIELEFDSEQYKKDWADNQLDKARLLK